MLPESVSLSGNSTDQMECEVSVWRAVGRDPAKTPPQQDHRGQSAPSEALLQCAPKLDQKVVSAPPRNSARQEKACGHLVNPNQSWVPWLHQGNMREARSIRSNGTGEWRRC